MKRSFDLFGAIIGLLVCWPLLLVAAVLIKLDSPGHVIFKQERIGRGFRSFFIYKFRTMVSDSPQKGGALTASGDPRITRVGKFLRQTKLDELPQLINVLKGDMSLVGPRPEVRKYVELFRKEYGTILTVRPGLTDFASLKYRDESAILAAAENPEAEYIRFILPDKLRLAEDYVKRASLALDLRLIFQTLLKLLPRQSAPDTAHSDSSSVSSFRGGV